MKILKTAFVSLIMLAPGIASAVGGKGGSASASKSVYFGNTTTTTNVDTGQKNTYASAKNISSEVIAAWQDGDKTIELKRCVGHAITINQKQYNEGFGSCIGESRKDLCRGWKDGKASKSLKNNGDDGVMLMMVARKITETGAYFCPTQIESHNKNESTSTVYTDYTDLASADPGACVWLCKPGYIGKECETKIQDDTGCVYEDTTKVNAWRYDDFTIMPSSDMENTIPMFVGDTNDTCSYGSTPQQHNVILAIDRWDPNSHGAFVRPFNIRAQRSGWDDMYSIIAVSPSINSYLQLVCQSGYEPNSTQDKCVKIKQCTPTEESKDLEEAPAKESDICPEWKDSFDDSIHVYYKAKATDDCFVYRCLQPGYAFVDARKNKCAACTEDLRTGVDALGMCVTCKTTQRFDKDSKTCIALNPVSKSDLLYGKGNTAPNDDYKNDCWSKSTPVDYVKCVKGATEK